MRTIVLAVLTLVAFSGCVEDDPDNACPADSGTSVNSECPETNTVDSVSAIPEDFTARGSFLVGHDPYNFVFNTPCSQPQSACDYVPFSTDVPVNVAAVLSWGLEANDLDLYLYTANGEEVSREGINFLGEPPSTTHRMPAVHIPAGDYEFYVVAWNAAAEDWELAVEFSQ